MADVPESKETTPADLRRADIPGKYHAAAEIANSALSHVIAACVDGADIYELCRMGDAFIEEKVAGIYNKKIDGEKPKKGVAFPTTVCPNEICGHFSPLKNESQIIKSGDLCKIDLGCHIDGFIALVAHTILVPPATDGGDNPTPNCLTGRKADVVMAAWTAANAAVRSIKEGVTNTSITEVISQAMEEFKCEPLQGVQSHQLMQHVIDGSQAILSKETPEERNEEFKFGPNEVYSIDIVASTGQGKGKESDCRSTIFKRDIDQTYTLKTQNGRKFIYEVTQKYPTMPFTIASFNDGTMARVGVSECMRHDLLVKYPVITEKAGEHVARFKFTILLLPGGTKKITGIPLDTSKIQSQHEVKSETLKTLLADHPPKRKEVCKEGEAATATNTAA